MLIKVKDLELRNLEFDESFVPGVLDFGPDATQSGEVRAAGRAELIRETRGPREVVEDIRLVGRFSAELQVHCARCLEPVPESVGETFDLIYRPLGVDAREPDASIGRAESEIGYYQGEGLLLEDVVKEQILLALPVKQTCRSDCKGLCPHCGQNLNEAQCSCSAALPDTRWNALQDIRKKMES